MQGGILLLIQAGSTWFMTGLIWFVQVVHYPLFGAVGREAFPGYESEHQRRTTWVVGPVMLMELGSAVGLAMYGADGTPLKWAWLGVAMLAGIWVSTAALQVPAHRKLASGYQASAGRRLVATNWIRTILWTGRAVLCAWWLA